MSKSLFNGSNIESIQYVADNQGQAVVTFSSQGTGDSVKMLIDSAQANFQRGVGLKRFLNSGPALMAGKGSGSLRLQGVFGTAEQLQELCGDPDNLCSLPRDLTLSAGVLTECGTNGSGANISNPLGSGRVDLVLHGCVVTSFDVNVTLQQDGIIFQGANVTMIVTDVSIA